MAQITVYDEPSISATPLEVNVQGYDESNRSEFLEKYGMLASIMLNTDEGLIDLPFETFTIDMTGMNPKLRVTLTDFTRIFVDRFYRGDRTLTFFYDSRSLDTVAPWHMDFYIMSIEQDDIGLGTGNRKTTLIAYLSNSSLYDFSQEAYAGQGTVRPGQRTGMSSWEVSRELSTRNGLGFSSNVSDTSDSQVWIQPGIHDMEMMEHVMLNSWKSDTSFMWGFIDHFYSYNYLDVSKCYEADFRQDKMLRIKYGVRPENRPESTNQANERFPETPIVLTNGQGWANTNHYLDMTKPKTYMIEQEALLSMHFGGNRFSSWYDISGEWDQGRRSPARNNPNKRKSWAGSFNTELLDAVNYGSREEISDKRLDYFRANGRVSYSGRLDTYNVHDNYARAKHANAYNSCISGNMMIEADMGIVNPFLRRMQKVLGVFYTNQDMKPEKWDTSLSGFWLISGMKLYGTKDEVKQRLTLIRRGRDSEEANPEIADFLNSYGAPEPGSSS